MRALIAVVCVCVATPVLAQPTTSVRGRVVDAATGEPVPGAFVQASATAGAPAALADENGEFALEVAPGPVELIAIADGYAPLTVASRAPRRATLILQLGADDGLAGEVVEIVGTAPVRTAPPSYELTVDEVRSMPGAANDALKSLQSLPGVARMPFGVGGLVLRGASPRDSSVYLDGVRVPLLFHFGGLASFYPSAMLDSMELAPGGFGAAYGRAQGGLVTLTSRPGRADRWRVAGEASLIDASLRADGPALGGTWSLGLRRSYVDAVLALVVPDDSDLDLTLAPRYYDGQLRYDLEPSARDRITVMGFGADDRLQFLLADDVMAGSDDRFRYISSFARGAARWQRRHGPVLLSALAWAGRDEISLRFNDEGVTRRSVPLGGRADLTYVAGVGSVSGGLDVQGGRFASDINNEVPAMPTDVYADDEVVRRDSVTWYADVAAWLEGTYRFDDGRLGVRPGIRTERYGLTGEWVVDPRIAVTHDLPAGLTLKETLGLYSQPPALADLDPALSGQDLSSSYAWQGSVGLEAELPAGVDASITGFYGESRDLAVDAVSTATPSVNGRQSGGVGSVSAELLSEQFGRYAYLDSVGRGRAFGSELFLKYEADWLTGWVAYTFSRSLRRGDPQLDPLYRPYVADQPHSLTALIAAQLGPAWRVGARVRYSSGNPFTPAVGSYYDAAEQDYVPIDGELLSERLPDFFQLDLRIDREWRRAWGSIALFLDVQNATNRRNPEGVSYNDDYSALDYTRGLPVFPSIGVEYRP